MLRHAKYGWAPRRVEERAAGWRGTVWVGDSFHVLQHMELLMYVSLLFTQCATNWAFLVLVARN